MLEKVLGTLTECVNKGAVIGKSTNTGGICGLTGLAVEKCINNGDVTHQDGGTKENLGGIVGGTSINRTIKIMNCYNTGKITEESNNSQGIGGIIGWISIGGSRGEVTNNYNIGIIDIKGSNCTNVGGAIGKCGGDLFKLRYNYYEKNKANVTLATLDEGLDASEMKTEEFVDKLNSEQTIKVWELGNGNNGYPTLK